MALRANIAEPEKLYTVEEFEQLPEFNDNYELIDGRLFKKVGNFINGEIAISFLTLYLKFDPERKIGRVTIADVNVKLDTEHAPAPDICFWKSSNRPPRVKGAAPRPDFCAEIWSDSDLRTKMNRVNARAKIARYLDAGVQLVWAINPDKQTVEIHRPGQTAPVVLDINGELSGENVIPGFKMAVRELFE